MVERAAELKMPAIAITDHGNLFAAIDFYEFCTRKGVKPILGCDVFVAPNSRLDRSTGGVKNASYPLVLLAETDAGYRNLIKLVSSGYLEGFYYKPRIDKTILRELKEGLIALSGGISSEIPNLINIGQYQKAKETAQFYSDLFGPDHFYLEIQRSHLRDQEKVNEGLIRISKEIGVPVVATSNVMYMDKSDIQALETMYSIQAQTTMLDEGRPRVYNHDNYFKTTEEICQQFEDLPDAVENTLKIAERCNVTIDFKTVHLPHFETPDNLSVKDYLRKLTYDGAKWRYGDLNQEVSERIEHELNVISNLGYDSYFLIVWDFVRFARDNGIPVGPGRGSAAGSVVSYCLGITNLDPIRYDLLFERFLNPARVSMPDIDIDFCFERRDEVIRYVTEKYGEDRVAQIITFGTMLAKGVLRDVGRTLAMPYTEVDRIAKLVPAELNIKLEDALKKEPELPKLIESDSRIRQLFDLSRKLEGLPRHASTHAAGVVISAKALTENVPLFKTSDGQISTMHTMSSLEKINMLKFDFLGLRTLTVVFDTVKIIKRTKGIDINLDTLDTTDADTYKTLSNAQSSGVFQLESSGMRDILRKLKPDKFEDLIAILALYRPGPIGSGMVDDFIKRKNGSIQFQYDHPLLEPILKDTYGIMVYQEQIMKIVSALAGFSLADADLLRRAIGKKKEEVIIEQEKKFVEGCVKNKVPQKTAEKIFGLIMHFAGYGFNKSHSAAYALISFQTAYLKTHYATEFMTALLSSEKDNTDKVVQYIDECRQMGIEVLPPDVNQSFPNFTVIKEGVIRFGLAAVKNVGQAAIDSVIQSRRDKGDFIDLYDFCEKVDTRVANRKTVESLIKCGAYDSLKFKRSALTAGLDSALAHAQQLQKDRQSGQFSLFDSAMGSTGFSSDAGKELPDIKEWPQQKKLAFEKELLGFYVTGHPLEEFETQFKRYSSNDSEEVRSSQDGAEIMFGGLVAKLKLTVTKKSGEKMAIMGLEDQKGGFEALVFPRVYAEYGHLIGPDKILFFKGRVDKKEEQPKLIVQEIHTVQSVANMLTRSVLIDFNQKQSNEDYFQKVQEVLSQHSGHTPVYINVTSQSGRKKRMIIDRSFYVSPDHEFVQHVEEVLGGGSVHLQV